MRKKEYLPFVKTWMDIEGIMVSEISYTQKDKHSMISYEEPKKAKLTKTECTVGLAGVGAEVGIKQMLFKGTNLQLGNQVLEI